MSENKNNDKKTSKDLLGRGIRSLLQNIDSDFKSNSGHLKENIVEQATSVRRIPLSEISINPKQPRRDFDETSLSELASSIKQFDIIQPLTVSVLSNGKYQLIAGERRLRASKIAGLKDVPVYIRQVNDAELLEIALLENLQREDLNAIEIGLSYKRMIDELSYTQEKVAERMGKERSTVTNYIRLLKLPPDIQLAVRNSTISMGHARAVIGVEGIDRQLYVFKEIKDKQLSVRQTEDLIRKQMKSASETSAKPKSTLPPLYKKIEDNLASYFSTKVNLNHNKNGSGSISIEYFSLEEMNKILDLMNVSVG